MNAADVTNGPRLQAKLVRMANQVRNSMVRYCGRVQGVRWFEPSRRDTAFQRSRIERCVRPVAGYADASADRL